MVWQKGQSGNPKGRKKVDWRLKAAAQEYGEAAILTLAKVMTDAPEPADRVRAAKELLDRGYGKAKESVEVSGNLDMGFYIQIARAEPERLNGQALEVKAVDEQESGSKH